MRRLLFALILALGLSPGLLWRHAPPAPNHSQMLHLIPLALPSGPDARIGGPHGPRVTGAWQLTSPNSRFGSYSALLAPDGQGLLAISDWGEFLRFPIPGAAGPVAMGTVLPGDNALKAMRDMELATRDPASGRIWIGLEGRNAIIRLKADLSRPDAIAPPQMRFWRSNGGPESMVRLADGRFIVLAESRLRWGDKASPGLLFPGDPLDGKPAVEFGFDPPAGFYPSDMAQLPDGRVLILMRGVGLLPPRFTIRLALADPALIRPGAVWHWQSVGELARPIPMDNYEGLAVTGGTDGGPLTLWLISDDNGARLLQHSNLLRLEWQVPPKPLS